MTYCTDDTSSIARETLEMLASGQINPCGLQGFEDVFATEPSPRLYTHTLRSANVKSEFHFKWTRYIHANAPYKSYLFTSGELLHSPVLKNLQDASCSLGGFLYRNSIQIAVWPCNLLSAGHGEKKLQRGSAFTGGARRAIYSLGHNLLDRIPRAKIY